MLTRRSVDAPKTNHRGLIITVIILLALGLGAWAYFSLSNTFRTTSSISSTPPPNPLPEGEREESAATTSPLGGGTEGVPADWQTYRNGKYGFEIKYPEGWKIGINEKPIYSATGGTSELMTLADYYFEKPYGQDELWRGEFIGLQISVHPPSAYRKSSAFTSDRTEWREKNNIYFRLDGRMMFDDDSEKIFNHILPTFRFVE